MGKLGRCLHLSAAAMICLSSAQAKADDGWQKVGVGAVEMTLDDTEVSYGAARQVFYKSGRTLYDAGRPSWGYWRAQAGQYCSEWPPQAGWTCYDLYVSQDGAAVKFVGTNGRDVSVGEITARQVAEP